MWNLLLKARLLLAPNAQGRILAIDYGSRRMGLAVSDALGITAQGLETFKRKNRRSDFARLERVIRDKPGAGISCSAIRCA